MLESLDFYYDNISSKDMGLINCRVEDGLFTETFLPSRSINEVSIRGNSKSYFQDTTSTPLEFNLTFAFVDGYDTDKLRSVARWLNQGYYKPLFFTDRPERIFFCMYTGAPQLNHNGSENGYITITFRCDSPYSYTPMYTTAIYEAISDSDYQTITFDNIGDAEIFPRVYIQKTDSDGDIEIFNSTTDSTFKFTGIALDETLLINCEKEIIKTNLSGVYRYDKFNDNYLSLPTGLNILKLKGNFTLCFEYYLKLLN